MTLGYEAYRGHTLFEATLKVVAPLHIGAGFDRPSEGAGDEAGDVAQLVIGANGLPVLTATGLKGAMRALLHKDDAKAMFGWIKREDDSGAIGVLAPLTSLMVSTSDMVEQRIDPGIDRRRGTFHAMRTAIAREAGVPASHKLFTAEMVAPGALFRLRMRLSGDPQAIPPARADMVACLLRTLRDHGLRLGRGRGDGQGLVKLVSLDEAATRRADRTGIQTGSTVQGWRRRMEAASALQSPGTPFRFRLSGSTAFLVAAGAQAAPEKADRTQRGQSNVIRALRRASDQAELPGPSLMGALRARAEWIAGLRALRNVKGHEIDVLQLAELFGLREDQRGDDRLITRLAGRLGCQPIEITGLAGLLRLEEITTAPSQLARLASVKLDRFTQGPMDRALFSTEAFVRPSFTIGLRLRPHPEAEHRQGLRRWVRRLLWHIRLEGSVQEGLMLGHGRNRGFGWFTLDLAP